MCLIFPECRMRVGGLLCAGVYATEHPGSKDSARVKTALAGGAGRSDCIFFVRRCALTSLGIRTTPDGSIRDNSKDRAMGTRRLFLVELRSRTYLHRLRRHLHA